MQKQGMVFNIQRYSLHDGTGLRTLVFMKGCPLRCKWCANPEGLSKGYSLIYNDAECVGCGKCIPVCKQGAIYADHAGTIKWNKRLCTECMECVSVCIPHARKIVGSTFTVEELLQEVEKDSIFYRNSKGGVTVGGGEPMLQADFVSEFLKKCREEYGINTAVETSCFAPWEQVKKVFDYTDIIHVDLKHMDNEIHKELIGVSNEIILDNLVKTAEMYDFNRKKLIIRMPIIPGLNSSDENINRAADFVKRLKVVSRVDLLPYHNFGAAKYKKLKGVDDYTLDYLGAMAPDSLMEHLRDIMAKKEIPIRIGG